jgi:hypothetical protein
MARLNMYLELYHQSIISSHFVILILAVKIATTWYRDDIDEVYKKCQMSITTTRVT